MSKDVLKSSWFVLRCSQNTAKIKFGYFFQTYAVLHSQIMDVHWSTQLNISFRPPSPVDGYFVGVTFDRG